MKQLFTILFFIATLTCHAQDNYLFPFAQNEQIVFQASYQKDNEEGISITLQVQNKSKDTLYFLPSKWDIAPLDSNHKTESASYLSNDLETNYIYLRNDTMNILEKFQPFENCHSCQGFKNINIKCFPIHIFYPQSTLNIHLSLDKSMLLDAFPYIHVIVALLPSESAKKALRSYPLASKTNHYCLNYIHNPVHNECMCELTLFDNESLHLIRNCDIYQYRKDIDIILLQSNPILIKN